MKILVVQETDWIKRYPHTQHHLFERLSLKGHTITVIDHGFDWKKEPSPLIFQKRDEFPDVTKIYPGSSIDVIRPASLHIPVLEYVFLLYSHHREILYQIKKLNPDLIMGFGILNAYLAARLAKKQGIPFIYYWIDALDTLIQEPYFRRIGRIFERRTIKDSKKIFVTNEKLKNHVIDLGADPAHIKIFSSGVDFTRFNQNVNRDEIRKYYQLRNDQIVLFFMGWIYHFSGLKEIAFQLAKEREKYKNFVLFVVGEGDAYKDLKEIRDSQQLHSNLILAGKQPYELIPKFIAAADICILPAYPNEKIMQDIVPIKLFEYLATGKQIIATRLPGIIKEFGFDNGITYIDKPEDTLKTAEVLAKSINFHEHCVKSHNFIRSKDWIVISNEFEKYLETVIHAK